MVNPPARPATAVPFSDLLNADLVIDRIYQGGTAGTVADDPISKLVPVGNQGGFRYKGSPAADAVRLIVLYTTGVEPGWPDVLDPYTGDFTYWGDNRSAGAALRATQRQGNLLLERVFERTTGNSTDRARVCPILLFQKVGVGRDVRFRGLLAPGSSALTASEELVAVWRTADGQRFQNYRAHFTVLDEAVVTRQWINESIDETFLGDACPPSWRQWVSDGTYRPLVAPPTVITRTPAEQIPTSKAGLNLIALIHRHFAATPTGFEHFAAELWQRSEPRVQSVDVTRPWRDGGRDAVGTFAIGPHADPISVEFALEAKCYGPTNSVGVREVSRLISRLRHRQFGVLVTTAHVNRQAYSEIRVDEHPVVIISGADIVEILRLAGLDDRIALQRHLDGQYPGGNPRPAGAADRS